MFGLVANALRTAFSSGIFITGEPTPTPPSFPCVSIVEQNKSTYRKSLDAEGKEHHANVMYEVNLYSNKKTGKKTECKAMAAIVNQVMLSLFFTCSLLEPVPNLDTSVYRMLGRYTAVVSEENRIYRK